jgi:hypothetical protein
MKHLKKVGMAAAVAIIAGAIAKYWNGEILEALFWMSVASALLIIGTEIKE